MFWQTGEVLNKDQGMKNGGGKYEFDVSPDILELLKSK